MFGDLPPFILQNCWIMKLLFIFSAAGLLEMNNYPLKQSFLSKHVSLIGSECPEWIVNAALAKLQILAVPQGWLLYRREVLTVWVTGFIMLSFKPANTLLAHANILKYKFLRLHFSMSKFPVNCKGYNSNFSAFPANQSDFELHTYWNSFKLCTYWNKD